MSAKQEFYEAVENKIIKNAAYNVIVRLTKNQRDAKKALENVKVREALAAPVKAYIDRLPEIHARKVVETALKNPGTIHGLPDEMDHEELLVIALIFLQQAITTPDHYSISAPTIIERMRNNPPGDE